MIASGKATNVATRTRAESSLAWKVHDTAGKIPLDQPSHPVVARAILTLLAEHRVGLDAVGHRFVHGGDIFHQTTPIDSSSLPGLKKCFPLAPIHNPNSYSVIEVCLQELHEIPEFAIFDTAFHSSLPEEARQCTIPGNLAAQYGFRKYGFHGLSYQYVSAQAAAWLGKPLESLKLIICHLGTGGASLAAIRNGHSIDTSMGYSPLPGLVMSTRCGDIDAEVVLELLRQGFSVDRVSQILNNESGLLGMSGYSSNLEEIVTAAEKGNPRCQLAFNTYVHRLKIYLGAYTWLLNGPDAIIFTDDAGIHCWKLRQAVFSGVKNLGIVLDEEANRRAPLDCICEIQHPGSRTKIMLVPTDEERVILNEVIWKLGLSW